MADNNDTKMSKDARSTENNAKNIKNAAEIATASGSPHAMAVGTAVKVADKATGGKSTEALAKGLTKVNKINPGGRRFQKKLNKLSESGDSDKLTNIIGLQNKLGGIGGGGATNAPNAAATQQSGGNSNATDKAGGTAGNSSGGSNDSSKSSGDSSSKGSSFPGNPFSKDSILGGNKDKNASDNDSDDGSSSSSVGKLSIKAIRAAVVVITLFGPFLLLILLVVVVVSLVSGIFGEFDDAFGMSQTLGEETGGVNYVSSDVKQELYDKIAIVKTSYQSSGKTVDAMKIIAVFHVLKSNGANIDYDTLKESEIRSWADSMLKNGSYDEATFKSNLVNSIIPKYIKKTNKAEREAMVKEILDYIDNYNDFIGKNEVSVSCGSVGSCTYDIKGFYINGANVSKNMQISDLKVRLMECGGQYGNGDYTKAIDQDLVDFEDYVAGVAYAEIGDSAPLEAIKAQMVAARSFALSRPTSMNNSLGKKLEQENGQWILQISSCVADQVFCNIDQGCSFMGGGDGQGGICRSGKVSGAVRTRDALPEESPIRKAITETQGEVLVNDQGYIIHTGYLSTEQNMWMSLANSGKNYKQILLQTYNQGSRASGASDVKKASCGSSSKSCASNGEYASWRQGDPQWGSIQMGDSGSTIHQIGCLVTSVSILMAKSGVETSISPLNPGTFVEFLNAHGGFVGGGNYVWGTATIAAPKFVYKGQIYVLGMSREEKLNKIKELVSQDGVYAVAEVKGNTGQHWVAIDGVDGSVVKMIDPASDSNDMWSQYNWANTSTLAYYKVE